MKHLQPQHQMAILRRLKALVDQAENREQQNGLNARTREEELGLKAFKDAWTNRKMTEKFLKEPWCQEQLWDDLFHYKKAETGSKKFSYFITTDGYDACIVLDRVKAANANAETIGATATTATTKRQKLTPPKMDHYIGIDPGKTYIMNSFDGERFHKMSAAEYYKRIQSTHQRTWNENLRRREQDYGQRISNLPSLKTTKLEDFKAAAKVHLRHSRPLFKTAMEKPFRKWRFKVDRFRRKTLSKLCKDTIGDLKGQVCVGIGDWSQPQGFKGLRTVPLKRMTKEFRRQASKVVPVNERNTSQVCSACESPVKMYHVEFRGVSPSKYKRKRREREGGEPFPVPDKAKLTESHQVVRCSNNECAKCWQRDINACRNIQKLLRLEETGQERPEVFTMKLRKRTVT
jgi:transposase